MPFNYDELRGKIRSKFRTQSNFAKATGLDPSMLSRKLNGRCEWSSSEIVRACEVLDIPLTEAHLYFFTR